MVPASGLDLPRTVRLGNSHLESLALDPPLRPAQVHTAAPHLHAATWPAPSLRATSTPSSRSMPLCTWTMATGTHTLSLAGRRAARTGSRGQQALPALRQQFGCSRMDKAYFCGSGIKLQDFERFGADVEVGEDNKKQRDGLLALGFEKAWVTDHLGIKTTFSLVNDTRL